MLISLLDSKAVTTKCLFDDPLRNMLSIRFLTLGSRDGSYSFLGNVYEP